MTCVHLGDVYWQSSKRLQTNWICKRLWVYKFHLLYSEWPVQYNLNSGQSNPFKLFSMPRLLAQGLLYLLKMILCAWYHLTTIEFSLKLNTSYITTELTWHIHCGWKLQIRICQYIVRDHHTADYHIIASSCGELRYTKNWIGFQISIQSLGLQAHGTLILTYISIFFSYRFMTYVVLTIVIFNLF